MSSRKFARALLMSTMLSGAATFATPAIAQIAPVRQSVDGNGVDLFLGTMNVDSPGVSIGRDQGMSYRWFLRGGGYMSDSFELALQKIGTTMTVALAGKSDRFTISGSTFTNIEANGPTLTYDGSDGYTYTRLDGTLIHFSKSIAAANGSGLEAMPADIITPSGDKQTFNYESAIYCAQAKEGGEGIICQREASISRLASVSNNYGYVISIGHVAESLDYYPPNVFEWQEHFSGETRNLAVTGVGAAASITRTFSGSDVYQTVSDGLNRGTQYHFNGGVLIGIKLPGSSSEDVTIAYSGGRVSSVTTAAGTVSYASSDLSGVRTVTVTDPLSHVTTYTFDIASQRMTSVTDALSHTTSFQYDANGRRTRVTQPEGDYAQTTYDGRGNVTEQRLVAKSGSGVSDIVTSAAFPASCSNPATCNEPTTTTDARGNVTNYAYDSTTGLVTSVTAPAPTTGATRPQTRYSYSTLQAYYNIGGSIVASGAPVVRLTGTSRCITGSSCTGTSDEVVTSIGYGPQTAGTGNNLLPVSTSAGAGDGSSTATATTTTAYDYAGNVVSVDGPLSGTTDTTTYRYDAARELVGAVSPDPDGAGSLKRRAVRLTYNPHVLVTTTEAGTVNGTTDTDWTAFVPLQKTTTAYDGADRKVTDTLSAGGTNYALTQYGYDTAGRPDCVAVRMNSATWGALPTSACMLGTTGAYGPDRISKTSYDAANRSTLVQTAYGTAVQADDATGTYNNNGTLATLTDANGNKTTYEYDGVDRLVKTRYPTTTSGAGTSSTIDYEQLVYDAASEITSRRLRGYAADSTQHIDFTYDALERLTTKNLPGSELAVTYGYDLLGHPVSAATSAQTLTFSYDALGRNLTQGGPLGTVSMQYNTAGRRTRLTWPDAFYVTYDHLVTGEVSAIRENGAASGIGVLATFTYDNLGQRTALTRGNGTSTSYGHDAVSRLTSLAIDLSGTTNDLTLGYSYTPASQIASTTRSNDLYAWGGVANRNDASTINGLNQASSVGATSLGYDAKGNLTSNAASSYTYSSQNLLLTGPSNATLVYDPLTRLYQESGTSLTTARFQYDGQAMIGEYDIGGTLQNRYVHGPGVDEPLVEYDKSGATYVRSWLHADERGSIVAASNDSGVKTAINSYDEYGVPGTANTGRFGYTGQAWLPSVGLGYYKARMYAPSLGRFMQTDPIGYGDGANWYNYTRSDGINRRDPSGLSVPNYCTGSIIPSNDCSNVAFLSDNGVDTQANRMDREIALSELVPSASRNSLSNCLNNIGCVTSVVSSFKNSDGFIGSGGCGGGEAGDIIVCGDTHKEGDTTLQLFHIPGTSPLDPLGKGGLYVLEPGEDDEIIKAYDTMINQIRKYPGSSNRKTGVHPYANSSIPQLPFIKGGQWYSATVAGGDGGRRLLVNSLLPDVFFYSPEHYEYFIAGAVDYD